MSDDQSKDNTPRAGRMPDDYEESLKRRPSWLRARPPSGARCTQCSSAELSALPMFSTGSGIAFRPTADDVLCRRCGHIGLPKGSAS